MCLDVDSIGNMQLINAFFGCKPKAPLRFYMYLFKFNNLRNILNNSPEQLRLWD